MYAIDAREVPASTTSTRLEKSIPALGVNVGPTTKPCCALISPLTWSSISLVIVSVLIPTLPSESTINLSKILGPILNGVFPVSSTVTPIATLEVI